MPLSTAISAWISRGTSRSAPANLDAGFTADWNAATTDEQRKRAVVDQVASLTDQSAMAWHQRLVG